MRYREQRIFAALADERRRELIEILSLQGMKTATELADALPITRQGISKHLNILAEAGLVQMQQVGREKRYRLNREPLQTPLAWIETLDIGSSAGLGTYLIDLDTT